MACFVGGAALAGTMINRVSGPGAKGYDKPKKQPDFWHRRILLNKALLVTNADVVSTT
jgi:hypothetical protein